MASDSVERWSRLQAELYSLCSRHPNSNQIVVELAGAVADDVVADIGCGVGAAVRRAVASGADATGVDPSPAMVGVARRRSSRTFGARFVVGDAADLPLPDDALSIVWSIASFHHWPDGGAGLLEVRRVLRPGGRLLIGEHRKRRAGGHGLTPTEADGVADLLRSLGYHDVDVGMHRRRLTRLVVVSATNPRIAA